MDVHGKPPGKLDPPIIGLLAVTIFLQSFSFLSLKYATGATGALLPGLLGLTFLFLAARAILWQRLLLRADLSLVYPFAALVQVLVVIYAVTLFGETVSMSNIAGLGLTRIGLAVGGQFERVSRFGQLRAPESGVLPTALLLPVAPLPGGKVHGLRRGRDGQPVRGAIIENAELVVEQAQ